MSDVSTTSHDSKPQLEVREVTKNFGAIRANDRINLTAGAGEIVGVIGPNGSGKTTLLNAISGFHGVDRGTIHFEEQDITGSHLSDVARLGIVRTFQQTRTFHALTILQNLQVSGPYQNFSLWQLPRSVSRVETERAYELLALVGLADQAHRLAGELSFGQQRLVELAMGLMNAPKILLLDEPTAGINPALINTLVRQLRRISSDFGITLIVVEHNIQVVRELVNRVYCLHRGRVLAEGRPEAVLEDQAVVAAYLGGD